MSSERRENRSVMNAHTNTKQSRIVFWNQSIISSGGNAMPEAENRPCEHTVRVAT